MEATFPSLNSLTLTNADTEYSLVIPRGTKKFSVFTNHASGAFRFAWESGKVASPTEPYVNVANGLSYTEEDLDTKENLTMYLASSTAGLVVVVSYWV